MRFIVDSAGAFVAKKYAFAAGMSPSEMLDKVGSGGDELLLLAVLDAAEALYVLKFESFLERTKGLPAEAFGSMFLERGMGVIRDEPIRDLNYPEYAQKAFWSHYEDSMYFWCAWITDVLAGMFDAGEDAAADPERFAALLERVDGLAAERGTTLRRGIVSAERIKKATRTMRERSDQRLNEWGRHYEAAIAEGEKTYRAVELAGEKLGLGARQSYEYLRKYRQNKSTALAQ